MSAEVAVPMVVVAIFTGELIGGASVPPVIVFVIVIGAQVAGASVDFHCFAFG